MSSKVDGTSIVRTLPPYEFPAEPISLNFAWHAELDNQSRAQIRQTVYDATKLAEPDGIPTVAIVHRPGGSLADGALSVDVYDSTGKKLCALRIADDGFGRMNLLI